MRTYTTLLRWLGPWASPDRRPHRVQRRTLTLPPTAQGEEPLTAWVYLPEQPPVGAYLILPGLHYLGPADPRMDRFNRALAAAGIIAFAPFIEDYQLHLVTRRALRDAERALEHLLSLQLLPAPLKPALWSVSFGSLLNFHLAAHPTLGPQISSLMSFGGYGVWPEVVRFCLLGIDQDGTPRPRDPLNQPVVYMNVFNGLPDAHPDDRDVLFPAWRRYIRATWGRAQLKRGHHHHAVAHAHAHTLPPGRLRRLFLAGCGATPHSGPQGVQASIDCGPDAFAHCDPRPLLAQITCPVHLVHAADDDVIPRSHLRAICDALPPSTPVSTWPTGLYGHSDANTGVLAQPRLIARELKIMNGMLQSLGRLSGGA
jgi:pimeloyl-ACP methyl ester carboxylesterase